MLSKVRGSRGYLSRSSRSALDDPDELRRDDRKEVDCLLAKIRSAHPIRWRNPNPARRTENLQGQLFGSALPAWSRPSVSKIRNVGQKAVNSLECSLSKPVVDDRVLIGPQISAADGGPDRLAFARLFLQDSRLERFFRVAEQELQMRRNVCGNDCVQEFLSAVAHCIYVRRPCVGQPVCRALSRREE